MRISAAIDGVRKGEPVFITIATQDANDDLVLNVPTVGRASACEFSIASRDLIAAIEALKGGPVSPRQLALTDVKKSPKAVEKAAAE